MQIAAGSFLKAMLRAQALIGVGFCAGCAFGGFFAGFAKALPLSQVF